MSLLLERDRELRAIDRAVARSGAGGGAVVVVEGVAGIGKTALLRAAAGRAAATGMRVSEVAGGELERSFPFGVLRALLEPLDYSRLPVSLPPDLIWHSLVIAPGLTLVSGREYSHTVHDAGRARRRAGSPGEPAVGLLAIYFSFAFGT